MRRDRLITAALIAAAAASALASTASASVLIARGGTHVKLKIAPNGEALVRYARHGQRKYVLAWGALNARPHPKCGTIQGAPCGPRQVSMKHRRIFSSGHSGRRIIHGPNRCRHYDGPQLGWRVQACKAPDGSYWALQSWVRIARNHGRIAHGVKELRLSHWHGPLENVLVRQTWQKAHGHYFQRLYGQITYMGQPVYGLRWTDIGVPLDGYGRVIYFDTLNSAYGSGWHRLDGFLSKPFQGEYCYNIGGPHVAGAGDAYRVTAMGAGVTPDILVGPFSAQPESEFNWDWYVQSYHEQLALSKGSPFCHPQVPR
jgi:hypothetical protein